MTELDSPAPRLCLHRAEWPPGLRHGLKDSLAQVWADTKASSAINPRETNSALIPIGEAEIDGVMVDFVWTSISDHIQVRFHHLEPNVIGHVILAARKAPALVAPSPRLGRGTRPLPSNHRRRGRTSLSRNAVYPIKVDMLLA